MVADADADADGDVKEKMENEEEMGGVEGVVGVEKSGDGANGVSSDGGVSNAVIDGGVGGGDAGVSGGRDGKGGGVMEVEGAVIPAVPVVVSSESKEEDAMDVSENGATSHPHPHLNPHPDQGGDVKVNNDDNGGVVHGNGSGSGGNDVKKENEDDEWDEDEGATGLQEVLDAQAQLDRIHLCLVNRLTGGSVNCNNPRPAYLTLSQPTLTPFQSSTLTLSHPTLTTPLSYHNHHHHYQGTFI